MKKALIYILGFFLICFILPVIFTKTDKKEKTENNNQENIENQSNENNIKYEYDKYGTIRLLHKKTGEVEEIEIDQYLCNVVSAEMPADFEYEALKAQSIVARTYTIFKARRK